MDVHKDSKPVEAAEVFRQLLHSASGLRFHSYWIERVSSLDLGDDEELVRRVSQPNEGSWIVLVLLMLLVLRIRSVSTSGSDRGDGTRSSLESRRKSMSGSVWGD